MGFCTEEQRRRFLKICPEFGKYFVDAGIIFLKSWQEVGKAEQQRRLTRESTARCETGKLSPMELESFRR